MKHDVQEILDKAWLEVQAHAQHSLSIATRLAIYDALINDLEYSIQDLIKQKHRVFPQLTPGLTRYFALGMHTVMSLMPLWDAEIRLWLAEHPDSEWLKDLPQLMIDTIMDLGAGYTIKEADQRIIARYEEDYWITLESWHGAMGNILDDFNYYGPCAFILAAVYSLYLSISGIIPYSRDDLAYDDIDFQRICDVAHYACGAWSLSRSRNASGDSQWIWEPAKTRNFWDDWLHKLVPAAAAGDPPRSQWRVSAIFLKA